jgi:hypothetical protein
MMKKQIFLFGWLACLSSTAFAMAVDWAGSYRFEYTEIDKTTLTAGTGRKSYLLNHLNLSPKIVAADGINIVANFEVLGNPQYPDSQSGQQLGLGVNRGSNNASNVNSQNQSSTNLTVRELYLRIDQEYGEIVAGRAPVQFGLGMTYNAGRGAFDHWGDIEDMVGYRFLIGNLSIMPMVGKPFDFSPAQGSEVTDVIADIEYNNPETDSAFGLFYRTRTSSQASNDAFVAFDNQVNPKYPVPGTGSYVASGGWSTTHTNIFLSRGWESFKFKMEAGFDAGATGVNDSGGNEVKLNGYGIALELDFPRPDSKLQWALRAGLASGDNPTTTNFEAYHFDRNYDVGFLLFNHPLGSYDALTSVGQRNHDLRAAAGSGTRIPNEEALDEEVISNAAYLSPKLSYQMSDKWEWRNVLTYAQVQTNPSRTANNDVSKDLGWEWDTALVYRPHERIQWVNELGFFLPGAAFKDGVNEREAAFTYGFQSKAAISF